MLNRLAENIRINGRMESLPFCAMRGNRLEIVSGHHRIRAARKAELEKVLVLVDTTELSRSSVVAKQLAHNSISGQDDADMLSAMYAEMDRVEDMLESFIDPADLGIKPDPVSLDDIKIPFDWKVVSVIFLSSQLDDFEECLAKVKGDEDFVALADQEILPRFIEALADVRNVHGVKAVSAQLSKMCDIVREELGEESRELGETWVPLKKVLGTATIPKEAAKVIKQAIGKMERDGAVSKDATWQAVEFWAADYLGTPDG